MKTAKDPICGMDVDIKTAKSKNLVINKDGKEHFFCSESCKGKFEGKNSKVPWYKSEKFGKLFPFFLAGILIVGTILSITYNFMILYMGIFFIIFSLFKMPDWKGFVNAFSTYDIVAKHVKFYGHIYPLIELSLGVLFIVNYYQAFYLTQIAIFTLIIMVIGSIGVGLKLLKREKFQCACLGTWINVPLTKVTLLENILMAIMAIILLL